jgi:HSP20 family protein
VSLRGSTSKEEKEDTDNFRRREIMHGELARTVALPAPIDPDQAKAKFDDGLLVLTLPKVSKTTRRKVEVE